MASTYLTFAPSDSTDVTSATLSMWFKRSKISSGNHTLFNCSYLDGSAYFFRVMIDSSDNLQIENVNNTATDLLYKTNRVFRDTSAWYHLTIKLNLSETGNDRCKVYINGVQETSFAVQTAMTGSQFFSGKSSFTVKLGNTYSGTSNYFDGLISHVNYTYNNSYEPTAFGEYDANGVWTIKTSPSVTYGTNGFFILKDGNSVTDQSGNGNNFTVGGGTLTNTEDSPSNVFATYNPLYKGNYTLSKGNLQSTISSGSDKFGGVSTFGVSSGKWYAEFKCQSASANLTTVGIFGDPQLASNNNQGVGKETNSISYASDGQKYIENSASSYGASYTTNDIIGVALDLDSGTKTITFYKNGVSQGAITISLTPPDGFWFMASNSASASQTAEWLANFGNGYFGSTPVASAGTNASGIGIFEFDVPTGYTALSTKGLNL